MTNVSKFDLFNAFANGYPMPELGFVVINTIQREDGSNRSYNVTGYTPKGQVVTKTVKVQ